MCPFDLYLWQYSCLNYLCDKAPSSVGALRERNTHKLLFFLKIKYVKTEYYFLKSKKRWCVTKCHALGAWVTFSLFILYHPTWNLEAALKGKPGESLCVNILEHIGCCFLNYLDLITHTRWWFRVGINYLVESPPCTDAGCRNTAKRLILVVLWMSRVHLRTKERRENLHLDPPSRESNTMQAHWPLVSHWSSSWFLHG